MSPPFQIKICGITTPLDVKVVCQSGADAIGLNFFPPSPRFIDESTAKEIGRIVVSMNASEDSVGGWVKRYGVFVNASLEEILDKVNYCSLDGVQLHGDERSELAAELRNRVHATGRERFEIIRAIRAGKSDEPSTQFERIEREIADWTAAGVDAILLDAAVPGEFGGTGEVLDWSIVPKLKTDLPIILAGGLRPENVKQAKRISGVLAVDVASGVESSPGVKDPQKIVDFVVAFRGA